MDANLITLSLLLPVAVVFDLRERRIPNGLVAVGLAFGLALGALDGGVHELGARFIGALFGLAVLFPFFALRLVGAGDVKLMAAVGSLTGPAPLLPIALFTFIAGGVLALVALAVTRSAGTALGNLKALLVAASFRVSPQDLGLRTAVRVPYAVAIAAGVAGWAMFVRG